MIRIIFTVFHIVKEDILKILPQNQRGNDDRNWIYLSSTEVISDAIFFVYPCAAPSQKYERVSHEMAQFVLKIAHLTF